MHEIETQIDIAATADRVWSILADFPAYANWNPFVRSIDGIARAGSKLRVSIQPVGGAAMAFRPTVLVANAGVELRWLGRLIVPGLFDGEHYLQLFTQAPGRVRFVQGEKFNGLLVGLAKATLERGTRPGFIAMNEALKARSETG